MSEEVRYNNHATRPWTYTLIQDTISQLFKVHFLVFEHRMKVQERLDLGDV